MVYCEKQGVSSCEIAGVVAAAALRDLRVNLFLLDGFPQISVFTKSDTEFTIHLIWTGKNGGSNVEFLLSRNDAVAAVKKFKKGPMHDTAIFERVQKAIAELEAKVRDGAA